MKDILTNHENRIMLTEQCQRRMESKLDIVCKKLSLSESSDSVDSDDDSLTMLDSGKKVSFSSIDHLTTSAESYCNAVKKLILKGRKIGNFSELTSRETEAGPL